MDKFLKKLFDNDCEIKKFDNNHEIIRQGLAPILATTNSSTTIQKANLLEQSKFLNWQNKAKILFKKLDENSIKFLVFKGFAYSFLLYDNSHIRPYSDIDVFIQEPDYQKTKDLLKFLGYKIIASRQGKFVSFQNSFYDEGTPQTTIDLHWQINNRIEIHEYFLFQSVFKNAIDIISPNYTFKSPNPVDAFILACFHYQAHRPNDRKHIWLYDLALLWTGMDEETKIKCLDSAKNKKQLILVESTLHQLKQTFVHCIQAKLSNHDSLESSQIYLNDRNRKFTDIKNRLKNIKSFRNKLRYLGEYVFQSKNYVKNRFQVDSNIWVYFYYPRMWIEDIFKLFRS